MDGRGAGWTTSSSNGCDDRRITHRPDLSDAPPHKVERGDPANRIGARGPMGRGEPGHNIIPELYPLADEPVIDKPGKGAFYQTDLELMRAIATSTRCLSAA